ncbi:unnamed protein product [Pylaiella littoralis]
MQATSSTRRNKLRLIQERETAKARLSRLQTMLQQKLVLKYGSKRNLSSKLNQEIEEEVAAFTARTSRQPTDEEFMVLENTIRDLRAKYVKNGDGGGGGGRGGSSTGSRGSGGGGRTCSTASGGRGGSSGSSKPEGGEGDGENSSGGHSDEGLPPSIARAWRTFDVAKQIEYETKEEHKAEKARLQKIIFKEELEVHRAQRAKKKAEEEEERRRHMEEQEKRLANFRMEQEAIKKRAADKHAEEKALREEQVKRLQAEKESERQARMEKEIHDIELCRAQLQGEVDEVERKRKMEKDRLAAIQAENAKQREIREQRQRESDEADALLLKEHRRRMDAEEQTRAAKLQQRMKHYEDIGNFWSKRRAGNTEADVELREAQQTLKAARRKEEATLERERKEREARQTATLKMTAENQKVIMEKQALRAKKHKEDMDFAQRFINDSEAFRQEERDKINKKRVAMAKYRKDLEIQVQETRARRVHEDMNDTEYRMNSDLVKRLEADKKMVAQVRQRMESAH